MQNSKELQYLTKPLTILFVLVVLIGVVISIAFRQITGLVDIKSDLDTNQTKLSEKLDTLESVKKILNDNINFVDIALPYRASVLYGLSQVKNLALKNAVIVTNLKAGSLVLEDNGISKNSLIFEVEGTELDIHNFLLSFYKSLPLMTIDKLKINKSDGMARATVTLYVYSADLPEKIPAVTESVSGLTSDDIKILTTLSSYTSPTFFDPKTKENPERFDPFSETN